MRAQGGERGGGTVAVVGIDGSGQSTHARALTSWLKERGYDARTVPFHRYLFLRALKFDRVRDSHSRGERHGGNPLRPFLSLIDNFTLLVVSAFGLRARGRVVVYDRYIWSTYLKYEALGYPVKPLSRLYLLPRPTACVLLDVSVSKSLGVIAQRPRHIKYSQSVLAEERERLLSIADSKGYRVVDANRSFSEVEADIEQEIGRTFPPRKRGQLQKTCEETPRK